MRSYLSFFSACARSNKGHVLFPLKVKLTKRTRCTFDIKKEIADFSSTVVASCLGIPRYQQSSKDFKFGNVAVVRR